MPQIGEFSLPRVPGRTIIPTRSSEEATLTDGKSRSERIDVSSGIGRNANPPNKYTRVSDVRSVGGKETESTAKKLTDLRKKKVSDLKKKE